MNIKALLTMAIVAVVSAALNGCGGSLFVDPTIGGRPNTAYTSGGYAAGGPVGAAMNGINNQQRQFGGSMGMPMQAGQNVLAGSGFDSRTHAGIWAQDEATNPPMLLASAGGPAVVTIPNGESAPAASATNGRAASDERVDRLAAAVTDLTVDSEQTRTALTRQGETLRRIDRRLRSGRRHGAPAADDTQAEPARPAPATPNNSSELVMDSVEQ